MSALPREPDPSEFGYLGLRLDAAEFLALDATRERYELVHGVVCMSPRPTPLHQRIISLIQFELELYARTHPGTQHFADTDLQLDAETVYAPDLVCYVPGRMPGLPKALTTPPDLVIEVLSSGTKAFDLTTKRDDYERFGVAEYWTIDSVSPGGLRARCYRRANGQLIEAPAGADRLFSTSIPGFTLDLGQLRAACEGR